MAGIDFGHPPERVRIQGNIDSQELKYRIENGISFLQKHKTYREREETYHMIDDMLWDFVSVVYERSMEPCLQDMCERLFRLNNEIS